MNGAKRIKQVDFIRPVEYNKKCITKPTNYYFTDSTNYIIAPCFSKCVACNELGNASIPKCTKCYSPKFLYNRDCS